MKAGKNERKKGEERKKKKERNKEQKAERKWRLQQEHSNTTFKTEEREKRQRNLTHTLYK